MSDLRKAAEMALDALHNIDQSNNYDAIEALRQALAKPEWVGLTDEEIDGLWKMAQMFRAHKHFYLLVEAKLKEKNT